MSHLGLAIHMSGRALSHTCEARNSGLGQVRSGLVVRPVTRQQASALLSLARSLARSLSPENLGREKAPEYVCANETDSREEKKTKRGKRRACGMLSRHTLLMYLHSSGTWFVSSLSLTMIAAP